MEQTVLREVVCCFLLVGMTIFVKPALGSDFLWGLSTHAGLRRDSSEQIAGAVENLRVNAIRDELYWSTLYGPSGFKNDLKSYDDIIRTYRRADKSGACLLLIINYGHPAFVSGLPDDGAEIAYFVEYVKEVLGRVDSRLCGVEVWNEWNIGAGRVGEDKRYGSPESYANLVRAVAPVIKALRPNVPIVVASLADKDLGWLRRLMDVLKSTVVDGVSVHPYVFGDRDGRPEAVDKWVSRAAQVVEAAYGRRLPIYVTEIGWPTFNGNGGVSERAAALNLIEVFARLRANPSVAGVWWYGLKDKGRSPREKEHNFGIYRADFSEKLAARGLRSLIGFLQGCDRGSSQTDGSIKYRCSDGEKKIVFSVSIDSRQALGGCVVTDFLSAEDESVANRGVAHHIGLSLGCGVEK